MNTNQVLFAQLSLLLLSKVTNNVAQIALPGDTEGRQREVVQIMQRFLAFDLDYTAIGAEAVPSYGLATRNPRHAHLINGIEADVDGVLGVTFDFTFEKKPGRSYIQALLRADGNVVLTQYAATTVNGYDRKIGEVIIGYFSGANEEFLAQIVHERNGAIRQAAIDRNLARKNAQPYQAPKQAKTLAPAPKAKQLGSW